MRILNFCTLSILILTLHSCGNQRSGYEFGGEAGFSLEKGTSITRGHTLAASGSPLEPFNERTPVLHVGPVESWDSWKLVDPHVIRLNDQFYLYFKGFNSTFFNSRKLGLAIFDRPTGRLFGPVRIEYVQLKQ